MRRTEPRQAEQRAAQQSTAEQRRAAGYTIASYKNKDTKKRGGGGVGVCMGGGSAETECVTSVLTLASRRTDGSPAPLPLKLSAATALRRTDKPPPVSLSQSSAEDASPPASSAPRPIAAGRMSCQTLTKARSVEPTCWHRCSSAATKIT
jgi:hypothetical protein